MDSTHVTNISSEMSIHENPVDKNKYVVGVKQGGIDMVDLQKKLYEAEMTKTKKDVKNISQDSLKIKALTKLEGYVQKFQSINNNLTNQNTSDSTLPNVFNDYLPSFAPVQGIDANIYLSASANPGANVDEKSYKIQVTQLAKADFVQSSPISGWAASLGYTGTININTSNYTGSSITISPGDNLSMIIEKINQNTGLTGVKAEQTTPSVGGNPILILRGVDTADPITITETLQDSITSNPAGLFLAAPTLPSTSSTRTSAQSTLQCQFVVDGVSYQRNTNNITDAINGVNFTALAVMPTETTLTFGVNRQKIYDLMTSWIESFNTIKTFLKSQSIETKEDDPNGDHVLANNPIIKKTADMMNQIKLTVFGVYDKWDESLPSGKDNDIGNIQSIGIKQSVPSDPFSTLEYEADVLLKRVNQNPKNIQTLMGQSFTSDDSNLVLNGLPSSFSSSLAGKNLSLTIQNYNAGTGKFDAVLTDGTTTETLTGVSAFMKTMKFTSAFSGFEFFYDAPITSNFSTNISITKGLASVINSGLTNFLQTPIDIEQYEKSNTTNTTEQLGDLSNAIYNIIQDKKKLQKKVDDIEKKAKDTYNMNIQKNQQHSKTFNNMQAVRNMINRLDKKG